MLNCTLSRSRIMSHTEGLMRVAERIYQANGVTTEIVRPVDFEVAAGLFMDLASTPGWDRHDWPQIQAKVDAGHSDHWSTAAREPGAEVWLPWRLMKTIWPERDWHCTQPANGLRWPRGRTSPRSPMTALQPRLERGPSRTCQPIADRCRRGWRGGGSRRGICGPIYRVVPGRSCGG